MGATRLDDLPEHRIVRALSEARQVSRERKGSAQRVSGANLAFFVSESASQFDWSGRLDTQIYLSGEGYAAFTITLTSKTAEVPMTDLAVTLFYSTDGVNWSEYTYARGLAEDYNGITPGITRFLEVLQDPDVTPFTSKYSLALYGVLNSRVALKVQGIGTDELQISVARTA